MLVSVRASLIPPSCQDQVANVPPATVLPVSFSKGCTHSRDSKRLTPAQLQEPEMIAGAFAGGALQSSCPAAWRRIRAALGSKPDRLRSDHVPGGWKGPGVEQRGIPGHPFGLKLPPDDK